MPKQVSRKLPVPIKGMDLAREVYANDLEIFHTWQARVAKEMPRIAQMHDIHFNVWKEMGRNGDVMPKSVYPFLTAFDPTKAQTAGWWAKELGLQSGHRWGIASKMMDSHTVRSIFTDLLSFSIPTVEALAAFAVFAKGQKVVEYMAGSGYWSWLLQKMHGIECICTDKHFDFYPVSCGKTFVPVYRRNLAKATPVDGTVSFISWVPYGHATADDFLKQMKPGNKLVWIGEGNGGCTATESTYEILEERFELLTAVNLVQFDGLHDDMYLYVKKEK